MHLDSTVPIGSIPIAKCLADWNNKRAFCVQTAALWLIGVHHALTWWALWSGEMSYSCLRIWHLYDTTIIQVAPFFMEDYFNNKHTINTIETFPLDFLK